MEQMHFIYVNANGIYGAHSIYKVSMGHEHFQGICCNSNAIRTFRQDRVLEHCVSLQEALDNLPKHIPENYLPPIKKKGKSPQKVGFDICFTGFKKEDRENLTEIAIKRGMVVRNSVTKQLQVLCCGYNAGPTKVTTARMQGVLVMDVEQFYALVETGEIPSE
ncbi:BRCT domain-containing protein [Rosenbergiella nectarea]|uniref:BRCT domain-containing protein n=1 Tax=Rosenbergiella nectarea TaxID=988801 RepID=UPI001F4E3F31|nr:BRCT domain-containing protein [Rosenbergiella nectarea]